MASTPRFVATRKPAAKPSKSTNRPLLQVTNVLKKIANFIKEKTFGGGKKSLILDKN